MTTVSTGRLDAPRDVLASVTHAIGRVGVVVPATNGMRDKVMDDFRKAHGLDLSDDDRAAWIRSKRR